MPDSQQPVTSGSGEKPKTVDLVCLGELLVDMFPAELGRSLVEVSAFRPKPGGAPANVAVAARRLGLRSAFIGKVGDEAFGHFLTDVLAREGVDVRGVRFDREARTPIAFIAMPDANHYEILFYRNPGSDMRLRADELDRELLAGTKAFHFGSISLIHEPSRTATLEAAKIARRSGALISFDVNYRPDLWGRAEAKERVLATLPEVDLLKVNEGELVLLTGKQELAEAIRELPAFLLTHGLRLCVVTLGPDGSYFQLPEGGEHVPAFKVEAVDATGCGDAFIAGLIQQLISVDDWQSQLRPERMRRILRYANAVGALTALTQGVIPALPTAEQVQRFLARYD